MARISSFAKDVALATAGIAPQALNSALAAFARQELQNAIHSGEGSSRYDKYVNGRFGADENTVVAPGPIFYEFHWWNEIIEYAIEVLQKRSPVKSGRFKNSWFPMVNGIVQTNIADIPIEATVLIVNNQPYARKIEVGFMEMSVPHLVVEDAMSTFKQRFGNVVQARKTFVMLPGGYVLKGVFRKGIREHSRTKLRRDTMAGAQMTYPAMQLTMRR